MENLNIKELNDRIQKESAFVDIISMEMNKVIVGQKHLVEDLLIGLLADGHLLLEGMPGLAKTLAISTLSDIIDAKFQRIQFPSFRYRRYNDLQPEERAVPGEEGSGVRKLCPCG